MTAGPGATVRDYDYEPLCVPDWADVVGLGLGMHLGVEKLRDRIQHIMEEAIAGCTRCPDELKGCLLYTSRCV